jgi:hypothetical protein
VPYISIIWPVLEPVGVSTSTISPTFMVRGPDECRVVFENDRPITATYAEAGAHVLHQVAARARPFELGVFDNELEIADRFFFNDSAAEALFV